MFCEECGTKNNVDAKFCISCGTTMASVENIPVPHEVAEPAIAQPAKDKLKPQDSDISRACLYAWLYGNVVMALVFLLMVFQYFSNTTEAHSLYRFWVNHCNSTVPFCNSMGHLNEERIVANENFIVYLIFFFLYVPLISMFITFPFAYNKVAAERKCKACGKKWALFFTGNSDLVDEFNHTANERETEREYRGEHTYKRDIFYTCVYLVSVYNDHYKCISCNDMTTRARNERQLIDKTVASVGGWISEK